MGMVEYGVSRKRRESAHIVLWMGFMFYSEWTLMCSFGSTMQCQTHYGAEFGENSMAVILKGGLCVISAYFDDSGKKPEEFDGSLSDFDGQGET